jgi:hypothetical protein
MMCVYNMCVPVCVCAHIPVCFVCVRWYGVQECLDGCEFSSVLCVCDSWMSDMCILRVQVRVVRVCGMCALYIAGCGLCDV